jgi:hypothetical protein
MEPDDITIRRIWNLENELAALKALVTAPTTILSALESDRKVSDARFDGVDRRLAAVDLRLSGMEGQLAAILAAVSKGAV